ncbi:hypothetical protein Tsubulata_032371 [Turnera subulata]|uniref:S-locus receptor kinase C-terminal domain-containing protein n=1 Tax=Turnera subulata TaxID=218843 RepID=A0A9Q0FPZ8_9ROSI|nr:hypothetical protein Tsubulata_032371 [Turnera subulata]
MQWIISGRKSKGFFHPSNSLNVIRLWKERNPSELLDASSRGSCNTSELLRCIHISLLCVQQHPEDRPGMASVVMMLRGENALPSPTEPEFNNHQGPLELSDLSWNELLGPQRMNLVSHSWSLSNQLLMKAPHCFIMGMYLH